MQNLVSVIIPTYNRPNELARLLKYQSEGGVTLPVYVLDGSAEDNGRLNQMTCAQYSNVHHHKFPQSLHVGLRLGKGLAMVRTPFVVICGDDDFFIPKAVAECAEFLRENPGFSAAIGKIWSLRYFPSIPLVRGGVALGDDLDHGRIFNQERFIQRAMYYFAYTFIGAVPLFYAVCRTDVLVEAYGHVTAELRYSSVELLVVTMVEIRGKLAKLPMSFGMRDYSSETIRNPIREGDSAYIPTEDIEYMRPILTNALADQERLSQELASYLISSVVDMWGKEQPAILPDRPMSRIAMLLRKVSYVMQCLVGRVAPSYSAKALGLSIGELRSLIGAHQEFTARRRS